MDAAAILTAVTVYAVGGAVILVARPGHRLGPLLLAASTAWGLGEGALAYAVHSDRGRSWGCFGRRRRGGAGHDRARDRLAAAGGRGAAVVPGRALAVPGMRWPVRLLAAAIATFAAGTLLSPQPARPAAVPRVQPVRCPRQLVGGAQCAGAGRARADCRLGGGGGLAGLLRRWRTADDRARGALRWFAVAFACPLVLLPLVATRWARGWMFAVVTIPVLVVVVAVVLQRRFEDARERVVRAREEERRRLRRDLHDGLGPALAALTLRVDALRNRSADPDLDLDAELGEPARWHPGRHRGCAARDRGTATARLGRGGHLAVALEQLAADFESPDGLVVDVHVASLPTLPAAVESALYRVAQEALTNVARHARAARARLTVTVRGGQVCLEVIDDGTGHVAAHAAGVGLTSMRERAEEISGSFRVAGRPGLGTTVRALFPLEAPRGEGA